MSHAPRPLACHDTSELRRHERGQRRGFWMVLAACAALLGYVLTNGPMVVRAVLL